MSSTNSTENHAVEEKYEDPQQQQQKDALAKSLCLRILVSV